METESSTIQKAADLLGKLRDGIGEADDARADA